MSKHVDHYGAQYGNFITALYQDIRKETYGEDIGQNGWLTAEEQDMFISWLNLDTHQTLLDIACGSGGPTLRIAEKTGCSVIGIDIHEEGIKAANEQTKSKGLTERAEFRLSDGSASLPFADHSMDAIMCIDAINHLPNRGKVLKEWNRVLKPKGKLLFTDPITVTGMLTKEDIEIRASIGYFLFVADGVDERLLKEAGFEVMKKADRTENMAQVAGRWKAARDKRSHDVIKAEGPEAFEGQQTFFSVCAALGEGKHLSRFAFLARKR